MVKFVHTKSEDLGNLVLRVAVGYLMLFHGAFKVTHGVEWIKDMLSQYSLPGFLAYGVYVAEIIAPVLVIIGYRTRLAALVIAFDMLVAILLVLRSQVFALKEMGGGWGIELEVFFLLGALAIYFTGAGKYSVSKGQHTWD